MPVADAPPRPPITQDPIVFDARRIAQTREYAKRHYGFKRARLSDPKVIVIHYTASSTYSSVFNTFNQNVADVELGETPQVCSHYVIDPAGKIHQLVSLKWICRHTVGLNYTAIGIEHVGTSADQVLTNARMMRASTRLVRWLQGSQGILLKDVIGHNESLSSPYHSERVARLRRQTHSDFTRAEMRRYRVRLTRRAVERTAPQSTTTSCARRQRRGASRRRSAGSSRLAYGTG